MSGPNLPSSFASAAAGQNSTRDRNSGRGDSRGSSSSNWLQRDGRSNGTAILRRASTTPFNNNNQSNQNTTSVASDQQQAMNDPPPSTTSSVFPNHDQASNPPRYSREDLLGLADSGSLPAGYDINSLLMSGFQPGGYSNGNSRPWAKSHDANGTNDPTVCWNTDASSGPLGLESMTAEEQEFHSNDVNSSLKQPQQQNQQIRDGGQGPTINGRKQSTVQGLSSPSGVPRPGARRRETTDAGPFGTLASPSSAGPRPFDSSSWFGGRKNTEIKETENLDEEKPQPTGQDPSTKSAVFPGLGRTNTASSTVFPVTSWPAATTTPTASAFGAFGNFALNSPAVADKGFASSTTGSRFFSSKQEPDTGATTADSSADPGPSWRPRPRTDTDPFGGGEAQGLSGSAALGGARDTSPPPMPTTHGSQIFDTPVKGAAGDFGMAGLTLGGSRVASPSQTNPYRSPLAADRGDNDHDEPTFERSHNSGGPSELNSAFNTMRSGFPPAAAFEGSDRSQTSSVAVGAKNVYPPLAMGGWPTAFTPDRERTGFGGAFGNSVFSPMSNEVQSPGGLGAVGGGLFGGLAGAGLGGGTGSVRGTSKLGSLFPPAMQAQMHNPERDPLADSVPDTYRQPNPLSAVGAGPIGAQARDTDSPVSMGRGVMGLGSVYTPQPQSTTPGNFSTAEHVQSLLTPAPQGYDFGATTQGPSFNAEQAAPGLPQPQARTMVMPDRMRWRYMDPNGVAQGPFTGLQMNQWYKESFFDANLRVRKEEDVDFEPLGQLIRRIGNSREPFLVPQVGIAHGPPPQPAGHPTGGDARSVVPPLIGVVPSYGKTLTAEEQNNLERRKQEDQQAQARQREYQMTQQTHQPLFRPVHPSGLGGLQHQASMHSLQSQPSYGSITSPIGMPPQAPIGGAIGSGPAGFFDPPSALNRAQGMPNAMNAGMDHHFRAGDYNEHERQLLAGIHGSSGVSGMFPPQPVGPPTTDLKSQLPAVDQLERDPQGFKDRLKEFQDYQGIGNQQRPDEDYRTGPSRAGLARDLADVAKRLDTHQGTHDKESTRSQFLPASSSEATMTQEMTLTEQVQKAQAANRQHEDPWARQTAATGLPMPFPAPHPSSATPIAAPTAQRRTHLADQYIEARSLSETPDSSNGADSVNAQPPPLAPWARELGTGSYKQPSLRDIQEAEARVRAKQDAERRAQQELEASQAREREKANPTVPGLPLNSTWGSGSPAPSAPSPWSKPASTKVGTAGVVPSASGTSTPSKKTLAEIQKEEEARKRREAKEQLATPGVAATPGYGKRYADLASKAGPPGMTPNMAAAVAANAASSVAAGWSTVGAGGKVKIPTGPQASRAVSVTTRAPVAPVMQPPKPMASMAGRNYTPADANNALEKWLKANLARGLKPQADVNDIVTIITAIGGGKEGDEKTTIESILYDAYDANGTVNPPQLTDEYLRRKRNADKGIFEPPTEPKAASAAGGWSEVAKKSSVSQAKDDMQSAGFKVVRKKAKK